MAKTSATNSVANLYVKLQKLSNEATEKSFKYNQTEANTARTWQKMMSDTAHQREVIDLKKAGLNPVLSANQGAQSYTTSSASGQAENPSNAIANVYGADRGARATEAAAAQNAAAMRYSAQQAASAQRYAAMMHYASTKYAWDTKTKQLEQQHKYNLTEISKTPAKNMWSFIDKYLERSGSSDTIINSKAVKWTKQFVSDVVNNPRKFFTDQIENITKNNAANNLNKNGLKVVNTNLKQLGINPNTKTRNLYVKAFVFRDLGSMNQLKAYMPKKSRTSSRLNRYNEIQNRKYGRMTV